ncbi:isoprenyl transferase [Tuanshanicoccus lijuaniae]|uniref:isoprenyl transferase n=1 Tax=Aerococcaceae bacterium zg-1292 TaxID=2774330 RepID=UPI001935E09F|nr:isoprenyl transferase [Aerococcaceae bacterium zg-1292]MBS4455844.1 isoprenyl transferase [Aerococcaceae bacterium zg-A91]MBS4457618.1 isoprenyl transferase [Aerococcaceae bacterium zg-BR33]QQA37970.1 isoprenyl transferase [Aerococcaceae bacterium zg-1292]
MAQENIGIPHHIGIIMDGNGRWAKKRFLPRIAGHKRGVETIKQITKHASKLGVKIITLYAFSTENWGRPEEEVNFLMRLPKEFFNAFLPELIENNCRVECIGDISKLPEETQNILQQAVQQSQHCTGLILNFAINYGGQQEILEAVRSIAQDVKSGQLAVDAIEIEQIEQRLTTARYGELANPDLIIRTSGEQRLSNFLLWQSAYSELYFTDVLWPDFSTKDFEQALLAFSKRQRRFGKV